MTSVDQDILACLDIVRRLDHDRFLTVLVAPAEKRAGLIALYAFNAELARIRETVSEPMLGQIRLQWWRETVEALPHGEAHGHEAAVALQDVWGGAFPAEKFVALIDARERDLDEAPFEDMMALEAYAEATSSEVMMLAGFGLVGEPVDSARATLRLAGIAYALTGLLRALPGHAAQGRLYIPLDLMRKHDLDPHHVFAGEMSDGLRAAINEIASHARQRLAEARATRVERALLPALWPASLCDAYLAKVTAAGFQPFRDPTNVPAFKLQGRLLGRRLLGRF